MTREEEEYFSNYRMLWTHPGWKQFLEDVENSKSDLEKIVLERCESNEAFQRTKGIYSQMKAILNFQGKIEFAEKNAEENEEEDIDDL